MSVKSIWTLIQNRNKKYISISKEENTVCILDLCDGCAMRNYWADYFKEANVVIFGAFYAAVPPYKVQKGEDIKSKDFEDKMWDYADKFSKRCELIYRRHLEESEED